ncbi:MAG: chemotaxis protein CheW [Chloroflexaceae bacterium]|nr:chemotaxis protein CheW [Chloroflexaceae bacterium]
MNSNQILVPPRAQAPLKLVAFSVPPLQLALPIAQVQKILNCGEIGGSGLSATGIIRMDGEEIMVVDLQKRLFGGNQGKITGVKAYLLIARTSKRERFGLVTAQAPALMDVPVEQIRVLPDSYRRSDTLSIASHVARIPQGDSNPPLTVFILDSDRLLGA